MFGDIKAAGKNNKQMVRFSPRLPWFDGQLHQLRSTAVSVMTGLDAYVHLEVVSVFVLETDNV